MGRIKTLVKVRQNNLQKKVIQRMKNNSLVLTTKDRLDNIRGFRLPLYFEKEVIANYPHELRDRGYTTGLIKMALVQNCIIVFYDGGQREHFRKALEHYAYYDDEIKTTLWKRILIKLNL